MTDATTSEGTGEDLDDLGAGGIRPPTGDADPIETDYEVGQDNIDGTVARVPYDIHNPVFLVSAVAIVAFVVVTLLLPDFTGALYGRTFDIVTTAFDWFFLTAANIFVLFCIALIVSPLGSVRIGGADAAPDYGFVAWFAMLFAAGMGIGLMFFGVAEPLGHFTSSLGGVTGDPNFRTDWAPLGAAAGDPEAAMRLAMAATILHWGLHPWAIYAVVGLSLALFSYNKGLPLTIRSAFYPIFGERVWGWTGHVIDILAVFATLFGLATSLGFGATQAAAGLHAVFGLPEGRWTEIILIVVITAIALVSVLRGLDGGVKILSEVNMGLAGLLFVFVLAVGPTVYLLGFFVQSLGAYVVDLPALSMPWAREDVNFSQGWTAFYWAWWISWSPFVGMFIARVSRGRTVRQFLVSVLLVPSLVCVAWMSVFGGTAIWQVVSQGFDGAQGAATELQLFAMLGELPLAQITSVIGIVLVIVFFVTSSDSGSLVIDTITAGGKIDAPVPQRVFWCTFEGVVAIVLLLSAGGLASLQSMVVSTGLPFTFVLLMMCYAIVVGLRTEPR